MPSMRTHGAIFRKLKEAKHKHLVILYRKYLRKIPDNCKYNSIHTFTGLDRKLYSVRLCLLHQNDSCINGELLDVCYEESHCKKCDAFVPRYSKEELKGMFDDELRDIRIKSVKYADICALEWVLERSAAGIFPLSLIQKFYFWIKSIILFGKSY